ncbi:MAG: helix-turn-helix transcriptional regulator [Planctomycetaceae bacterium]|nr:helix-turn-helix transcriptional regulator [Planctomycetaceae bacterium]
MEKSLHTDDYSVVVALLREIRKTAKLTQVELAEALGQSQSFVSKYENGDTRLDILQLRTVCQTLGTGLPDFVAQLEDRLRPTQKSRAKSSSTRR